MVNENFASVISCNKTKTFLVIKPFNFTVYHYELLILFRAKARADYDITATIKFTREKRGKKIAEE